MKAVLDILTHVHISVRLLCVLTHRVNLVHARVRARREFGLSLSVQNWTIIGRFEQTILTIIVGLCIVS